MVMDIATLLINLIDEAKKQKNLELVDKLIDIKLALCELQDENNALRKELELQDSIIRHKDGNYITLSSDPQEIKYCSTCWGKNHTLIQINDEIDQSSVIPKCPICLEAFMAARNGKK